MNCNGKESEKKNGRSTLASKEIIGVRISESDSSIKAVRILTKIVKNKLFQNSGK